MKRILLSPRLSSRGPSQICLSGLGASKAEKIYPCGVDNGSRFQPIPIRQQQGPGSRDFDKAARGIPEGGHLPP